MRKGHKIFHQIRLVFLFSIMCFSPAYALIPVEGILLGEVEDSLQSDPLKSLFFTPEIETSDDSFQIMKLKSFYAYYEESQKLEQSCHQIKKGEYASLHLEEKAKRSVVSSLQYIGLDLSIKAIGAYAQKLKISETDFEKLTESLMGNYCSQNLTVFSLKFLEKSFKYYYENPLFESIPTLEDSPFVSQKLRDFQKKSLSEENSTSSFSKELDYVIKNFRAFCSWNGNVYDYQMLSPYLKNHFIMSFLFHHLMGLKAQFGMKNNKISFEDKSPDTIQVLCDGLICRKSSLDQFNRLYPRSLGSTGLDTDLHKLYCHHFSQTHFSSESSPQVLKWVKELDPEEESREVSMFISLMTKVPDLKIWSKDNEELFSFLKSKMEEDWDAWAQAALGSFSQDFFFEESLKVKVIPQENHSSHRLKSTKFFYPVELDITLGFLDQVIQKNDKFSLSLTLMVPKSFLSHTKRQFDHAISQGHFSQLERIELNFNHYVFECLREMPGQKNVKIFNENFYSLIASELYRQIQNDHRLSSSFDNENISVPIHIYFGVFALGYMNADWI